jgi:EAL domain-containing protein (putative c-di-GMP-specific phosphodiesterase class I)
VGSVKDASGAVVPSATVTLKYTDTNDVRTVVTNESGQYHFSLLKPGDYIISAQTSGLRSNTQKFTVQVGEERQLDITMNVQGTQEVIEVQASAAVIETENANSTTTLSTAQVTSLPMNGGDLTTVAFTVPGVRMNVGGGSGNFNANGIPLTSVLFTINGADVSVRPSIGVSVWPDDGRRVDDLLAHAEVAMALAKERGGEVQFFQRGMTDSMHERLALENDLRRGLAAGEFELSFQPVMSAKTGRIITAEALLRWRHPLRGVIGPSSFIPLAEESGLMIPLGEWVIRETCRYAAAWQLNHGSQIRLAVNLSATQFRHQNLVEVIRSALAAENLDPRCLEIELTESAVMTNPEESVGVLKQLRKMGVTVAVDDFGTGYSSLSYLRRFPIDKLKIDRSFVRDLATSRTDESIVRAIISLAHSVGLQVVAEGVESEEQLRCVRALGCDHWQGYYCCEPQPAELFGAMLRDQAGSRTGLAAEIGRAPRPAGATTLP